LLQCLSPLLAHSCRAGWQLSRRLSGVKRTRLTLRRAAANDPKRTFGTLCSNTHKGCVLFPHNRQRRDIFGTMPRARFVITARAHIGPYPMRAWSVPRHRFGDAPFPMNLWKARYCNCLPSQMALFWFPCRNPANRPRDRPTTPLGRIVLCAISAAPCARRAY
jgi:hypothetical protein